MKAAGIIAEYNPIHAGHEYHIKKTREHTGADFIIVCMSTSFTQRGIPAFFDTSARVHAALFAGADIVCELPLPASISSAEYFASAAVSLLNALGCEYISFGSECGDISSLGDAAEILLDETGSLGALIRENTAMGLSYPAAADKAVKELHSSKSSSYPNISNLISSPNNMLGIEYIKAIRRLSVDITPVTIKREGMAYHEGDEGFFMQKNAEQADEFTSSSALRAFYSSKKEIHYLENDDFSDVLSTSLYKLSDSEGSSDALELYADINTDLADKIRKSILTPFSFSELAARLKSRNLTLSRINRALWHIILGIKKDELVPLKAGVLPYIRILGIKEAAGSCLKSIREASPVPLIEKISRDREKLDEGSLRKLRRNLEADELYRRIWYRKYCELLPSSYDGMIVHKAD